MDIFLSVEGGAFLVHSAASVTFLLQLNSSIIPNNTALEKHMQDIATVSASPMGGDDYRPQEPGAGEPSPDLVPSQTFLFFMTKYVYRFM